MRDLVTEEHEAVSGGMLVAAELTGWVPDSVLSEVRANLNVGGPGNIAIGLYVPGIVVGPAVQTLPTPVFSGFPPVLPQWDC